MRGPGGCRALGASRYEDTMKNKGEAVVLMKNVAYCCFSGEKINK